MIKSHKFLLKNYRLINEKAFLKAHNNPEEHLEINLKIGLRKLSEIRDREEEKRFLIQSKKQDQVIDESKQGRENIAKQLKEIKDILTSKNSLPKSKIKVETNNDIIYKRKLGKDLKAIESKSILYEDLFYIIKVVLNCRTAFHRSKYILAHIILNITGLDVSALKYFNWEQIKNLFEEKEFSVRLPKKMYFMKFSYPFVNEIRPLLNYGKDAYNFMKECIKKGHKNLWNIDKNNEPDEFKSEIWGKSNLSSLNRKMNEQLKLAGSMMEPKKFLTTSSYKRGIKITSQRLITSNEAE